MPPGPRTLRAAGAAVLAEGLALAGLCVAYLVAILTGRPHDRGLALFGDGLGFVAAAVLLALGRPLAGGRRFARTPVLLLQVLAVPIGVALLQDHRPAAGVPVLAAAAAVLALLVTPSARVPFSPGGGGPP